MNTLSGLLLNIGTTVGRPGGLWPIIIDWIQSWVQNFGWTIIIFTLLVKLVLMPLDFLMKLNTKKEALLKKRLAPQIEKINFKYKDDPMAAFRQTQAIMKKERKTRFATLFSLLYLVLTLVVFITLFNSLRDYAAHRSWNQYVEIHNAYETTEGTVEDKKAAAESKFNETKDGWLWVDNIWIKETYANPVPDYSSLKAIIGNARKTAVKEQFKTISNEEGEAEFNLIMGDLVYSNQGNWNGYFILAILAAVTTFLSQWIADRGNKVKREKTQKKNPYLPQVSTDTKETAKFDPTNSGAMKVMKFILPAVMVVFVITSSAAFGLYIVASSIIGILSNLLINFLVKKLTKKEEAAAIEALERLEQKKLKKQLKGSVKAG